MIAEDQAPRPLLPGQGRIAILVLAALGWLANGRLQDGADPTTVLAGTATMILAAFTGLHWKAHRKGTSAMPLIPIVAILHGIYFGLPVLLGDPGEWNGRAVEPNAIREAALIGMLGLPSFLLGVRFLQRLSVPEPLVLTVPRQRLTSLSVALIAIGLASRWSNEFASLLAPLGQIRDVIEGFVLIGMGLLWFRFLKEGLPLTLHLVLWGLALPAAVLESLSSGSVANLGYVALFMMMVTWGSGRRVSLLLILVVGLFAGAMRSAAEEFREFAWRTEAGRSMSSVEKTKLFLDIAVKRTGNSDPVEQAGDLLRRRTNHLGMLGHVVELTGDEVPYWRGETIRRIPMDLVPRVIWPDKPGKRLGQDFGHRYHILDPADRETSVNLPMIVELQANFGAAGAILGMGFIGMAFGLFLRLFNRPGRGVGTLVIGAFISSRIVNIESDIGLVLGAVPHTAIGLYVLFRFAGRTPSSP